MRNHPIQNRQYNRGRLLMKISPQLGIGKDNRGRRRRTGSDEDISSDECSKVFERPVTESVTAWAGRDSHCPSDEHSKNFGRPVTEAITARAGSDADKNKKIPVTNVQICSTDWSWSR